MTSASKPYSTSIHSFLTLSLLVLPHTLYKYPISIALNSLFFHWCNKFSLVFNKVVEAHSLLSRFFLWTCYILHIIHYSPTSIYFYVLEQVLISQFGKLFPPVQLSNIISLVFNTSLWDPYFSSYNLKITANYSDS